MAVRDFYQLRSPVNTDDLVDQINRMFQRLMVRLDGLDLQLSDLDAKASLPEPSDTVVEETTYGQESTAGTSYEYSRGDHTHGTPEVSDLDDLGNVDFTGEAWGDLIFRGEDEWNNLAAGTNGQVLKTAGADADPAWGDLAVADLSDVEITDAEQGDLLHHDGEDWVNLHHGTDGQVLTTKGDGADLIWADLPAADVENAWPIGSVFLAVVATDPATLLGFGTWARIAEGQLLAGYKSGDADFGTVEGTGGTKTHTLTSDEMPSHTHVQDAHDHDISAYIRTASSGSVTTTILKQEDTTSTSQAPGTTKTTTTTATNQNTGGGEAHNNLPPYVVVYVWKRTA